MPTLLGNSVSELMRFTISPEDDFGSYIGLNIKGGNFEPREITIDLDDVDEKFRLW